MARKIKRSGKTKRGAFAQTMTRLSKSNLAKGGLIVLAIITLACVLATVIAPYGPDAMDLENANVGPTAQHLCGTDNFGRDLFARLLYGGRYTMSLGLCGALFGSAIGLVIGLFAGYFGGTAENVIMRIMDIMQAIPGILISILISAVLGSGFLNTVIALSVGGIPFSVRIVRGQILSERGKEYLEAAQSINCGGLRIMFSHLLPNILSPLIVLTTMGVGGTIMAGAGLSFIGLGVRPPTPEWGAMLSAGRDYIRNYPHLALFPGLCIAIAILAINIFGDGLRDALDPKMKK
jgi:peptide/nickel transport system permease protein